MSLKVLELTDCWKSLQQNDRRRPLQIILFSNLKEGLLQCLSVILFGILQTVVDDASEE